MLGLLVLAVSLAQVSQQPAPAATVPASFNDYKFSKRPLNSDPASQWQRFFSSVADLSVNNLAGNAQRLFLLTDSEYEHLLAITLDLARRSRAYKELASPYEFEARMQTIESNKVSAAFQEKLNGLDTAWAGIVLDHAEQLRKALREPIFRAISDFNAAAMKIPPNPAEAGRTLLISGTP